MDERSSLWEKALCANIRDDTFWTDGDEDKHQKTRDAKALCKTPCPIRMECLNHAIENKIRWGIWGGFTGRERREIEKERRKLSERGASLTT